MTVTPTDPAALPKVSPQHCLKTRFNGSSCSLCLDACPHDLPNVEGVISIDAGACSGCQLCAAACPGGAIEPQLSLEKLSAALSRPIPVVLACHQAQEESHLTTPCFGFLAEEYLLAMYAGAAPRISLNLLHCAACSNHGIVEELRGRIAALEARTGLPVRAKVRLIERAADLHFQPETVDRRGFFRSLTRTLVREAATVLTAPVAPSNKPSPYAQKHLPLRRTLLYLGLDRLSAPERQRLTASFAWRIARSDDCDGCRACTKICPTGALIEQSADDAPPFEFDASICTGCGLCVEFCLNGALSLTPPLPALS